MQSTPPDPSNSNAAAAAPNDTNGKRNRRGLVTALVAAVVLAIAAIGYQSLTAKPAAPDVTFTSLSGERIDLKSLRGKVVMVNFWATSCSTCVHEMPQMVDTYTRFKDRGLNFVAVAMSYDPPN
jgi:cytochrome oxidase Cu insertion factor (SCO1/SenC/PrrC family)